MRKQFLLLLVGIVCLHLSAWAQDAPKAEIFGGFSATAVSEEGEGDHALGWQASVAVNLHRNFGIVADFGGQYKNLDVDGADLDLRAHEFLFGPRFNARLARANPFVHWLVGGVNAHASANSEDASDTFFMMGIGGGVDVDVSDRLAVRLVQFDWLPVHVEDQWFNKIFRVGIGIVFKAGQ